MDTLAHDLYLRAGTWPGRLIGARNVACLYCTSPISADAFRSWSSGKRRLALPGVRPPLHLHHFFMASFAQPLVGATVMTHCPSPAKGQSLVRCRLHLSPVELDRIPLGKAWEAIGTRLVIAQDRYPHSGTGGTVVQATADGRLPARTVSHLAVGGQARSGDPVGWLAGARIPVHHIATAARRVVGQ